MKWVGLAVNKRTGETIWKPCQSPVGWATDWSDRPATLAVAVGVFAVVGLGLSWPRVGWAADRTEFESRVESLETRVNKLQKRYLESASLHTKYGLENRFNEAKVAYVLEDYEQASIMFADLLKSPGIKQFSGYRDLLYFLAESLFKLENYLAARVYYRKLVDLGEGKHYESALVRLLKIASRTKNFEGVAELQSNLAGRTDVSPAVNYIRGKVFYEKGDYHRARQQLLEASNSPEYAHLATYFVAVTYVATGDLEKANGFFKKILEFPTEDSKLRTQIRELTYLGLGRIAYEQKKYQQAVDYYQRIPHDSQYFDRALYELSWVFIGQGNLEAASRVVDIFFYLSNPNPAYVPQVRLLNADLLLRQSKYDRAHRAYENIVKSFQPTRKKLRTFQNRHPDLLSFFEKLIQKQLEGDRPNYLPESIRQWVGQSSAMKTARKSLNELRAMLNDINESQQTLRKVEARLKSGTRIQAFPILEEGNTKAIDLEQAMLDLYQKANAYVFRRLKSQMDSATTSQFTELDRAVSELQSKLETLPVTRETIAERHAKLRDKFTQLERQLARLRHAIRSQRGELDAIETYLERSDRISGRDAQKIRKQKQKLKKRIERHKRAHDKLKRQIALQKQKRGAGDAVSRKAGRGQRRYRQLLDRQYGVLEKVVQTKGLSNRRMSRIWSSASTLRDLIRRVNKFQAKLQDLVDERIEALKKTVRRERQNLAELERRIKEHADKSQTVAAKIARTSFLNVKKQFEHIVLRGKAGMLDVNWKKKEDTSRKIDNLIEKKSQQIEHLKDRTRQ